MRAEFDFKGSIPILRRSCTIGGILLYSIHEEKYLLENHGVDNHRR
jgi:hypothetical protein